MRLANSELQMSRSRKGAYVSTPSRSDARSKPEPEPVHADQAGAALFLPDRLAADQPLGPLRPGQGALPGLWSAAWPTVQHLGDGRWWDETEQIWRNGRGRRVPSPTPDAPVRTTKVVLAAAHLDHDPAHCGRRHRNVRALCQRCHMLHDRPEHRRRIRMTLRRRRALGDLFSGPYPSC